MCIDRGENRAGWAGLSISVKDTHICHPYTDALCVYVENDLIKYTTNSGEYCSKFVCVDNICLHGILCFLYAVLSCTPSTNYYTSYTNTNILTYAQYDRAHTRALSKLIVICMLCTICVRVCTRARVSQQLFIMSHKCTFNLCVSISVCISGAYMRA